MKSNSINTTKTTNVVENNRKRSSRIKIAYIIPRFFPFKGGAEENFFQLSSRMAKKNYKVTVLTCKVKFRNEKLKSKEKIQNIQIIRMWQPGEHLYLGFYPALLLHLLKHKYDVIHTSGIGFVWREICLLITKLTTNRKALIINTPHGPFMATTTKSSFIRNTIKIVFTQILKVYLNIIYDAFIQVNPRQAEWLQKEYKIQPNKVILVPNGIPKSYLEKPENLVSHRENDPVIITFIGRMEWYKGIHNVIKSLYNIKDLNWRFLILGRSGNYTKTLKRLVEEYNLSDKIEFIFSPTDEERDNILKYYSQVIILPSLWEATGISLIEGMAKGNVIITTKQNESAEMLVKHDINGYIYDFYDTAQLTQILKNVIVDNAKRLRMRKYNILYAKNFTWEKIFSVYENFIRTSYLNKIKNG